MRRKVVALLMILTCIMLSGCFEVKNTDGLRAAYEKIELAYPLAVEVDARQNIKPIEKRAIIDSYNEAKASVNSFLKDVKTKSVNVVNVPKEAFEKDKAGQKIDKFIVDAKASRKGEKAIPPAVVVAIAVPIIEKVWELNKKNEKESYERFTKIIDDNLMVEFDQVPAKLKR